MDIKLLEAGKIVNTHGTRGEVRVLPWADSPGFLEGFERFYIDGAPIEVLSARAHKSFVIVALDGVTDIDGAIGLKNKTVFINKDEAPLEKGRYFIADIIGCRAVDAETGRELGAIEDVLSLPANNVYVVRGEREILVPAVDEFIIETNIDEGYIRIKLIEGL